ncbi:outer membrane beta-barrel family protein [Algoriphagus aquimarinus]|uniref:Outer membrane beta-barrel protein n=1 Tax=Algoriphagus aquimarinus TaxID=237018 RepID=A0A5C7ACZ2_9BACT|nr:outer membrane beta-barrel family protein [Algoriphagus aquimarinus]TXE06468.1 outer membrane beta-barrel protein [Algoriphagus aquimarinus]
MKNLLIQILLSVWVTSAFSQEIIQGKVIDLQSNKVSYANVLLLNVPDSTFIKGAITDESGVFTFTNIPKGNYFIETSFLGYTKAYSPVFNFSGMEKHDLDPITLTEEASNLEEVTISASRPLFEMEMGKMVVNVANSVTSAGFSVIDLLERSPGVIVNRQNNTMSLAGKNGVVILMNGKRFRMPVEAAFQMLAGLNSSDVEKLEIITVPPANYDADGDAGFINVVMKRNNGMIGTNGSVTVGQGYGSGYQGNLSFNINHQGPKFSWFTLVTPSVINQVGIWESRRSNNDGFEDISINTVSDDRASTRKTINYQAGFDYSIGKNTTLSALVSGYENRWNQVAPILTEAQYSISPDTTIDMTLTEKNYWSHIMGNINIQHTFQNGQVLSADLDYLTYNNTNPTWYTTTFFDESDNVIDSEEFRISKDTPIDMWVSSVNHSMKIGKSVKVDSGIKGTFSELSNTVVFEEQFGSEWIGNPTYSSDGILTEDILAAFSTAAIVFNDKTSLNAGLRYENTKTNLTALSGKELVNRNYGDFFPTVQLAQKMGENSQTTFSYGRRITRPTFNQMAPWVIFSDRFTLFAGNTNILPTYTNNLKVDYSFKSLIVSAQYSHDKNAIAAFQPTLDEETNTTFLKTENIDQIQTISIMFAFPIQLTPWWEMQNNFTANFQRANSVLNDEAYEVDQKSVQVITTNTFTLPKKYAIELVGYYNSPTINGYFLWLSRGFVNLGIKKDFEKAGVLRLSCNDIFETTQLRWNSFEGSNIGFSGRYKFDKRVFMATYTYNFGNNKVKGTRSRSVGSQAEQRRVSN